MKLLVVLEHRFYKHSDGGIYCERVVDYNFLRRYLNVFEEIIVCGRFDNKNSGCYKKLRVDGENVSFVELPDFKGIKGLVTRYFSIRRIIKNISYKCDAVLLRAPSHISFIAFSAIKKHNKPLAVEMVVNPRTAFNANSFDSFITRFLFRILQRVTIKHAKELCVKANGVSYVTQHVLQEEYPSSARLYGESKEYFEDYYSTINLKNTDYFPSNYCKQHNDAFTICHTGYMDGRTKGHITVIDTLYILLKKGYNVKVKFIGSGKLIEKFKKHAERLGIASNVEFLGNLYGYNEVQNQLLMADMFVFPTMSEGLPRSLIEAMANKLPCVSSATDGIPELLDKEFLAPYDSPEEIAQIIANLIDNPSLREKAATDNYNKAKEYSECKLTIRRNRFYKKLYNVAVEK